MIRSKALCTARSPFALEMASGRAAQRLDGGSGTDGRIGWGMPSVATAAPLAVAARNSRRDRISDTTSLRRSGVAMSYTMAVGLFTGAAAVSAGLLGGAGAT